MTLCTDSYSLAEVENLIEVINTKFNLNCKKSSNNYRIIIPAYSIPTLHKLLALTHSNDEISNWIVVFKFYLFSLLNFSFLEN